MDDPLSTDGTRLRHEITVATDLPRDAVTVELAFEDEEWAIVVDEGMMTPHWSWSSIPEGTAVRGAFLSTGLRRR